MKENKFRRLAVVLAAVMSVGLASCGGSDSSSKTDTESQTTEDTSSVAAAADSSTAAEESTADASVPADESSEAELSTVATKAPAEILAENPAAEAKSATLKEIGKLKGDDGIVFYDDFLYKMEGEDKVVVLDYQGKPLADKNAVYVDKLGDTGLFAYQIDGSDVMYEGIIDGEGNVIIDGSAKVGMFDEIDSRYLKAYIPDKVTTNKEEAIYYATNRQFSTDVKDEDVMYTGTVKVYDTVNRKFLESTAENFDPHYTVNGDIITFYDHDDNNVAVSVESDTKLDLEGKQAIGRGLICEYKDGKNYYTNHNGDLLFVTENTVSVLNENSQYYTVTDRETNLKGIIHENGTVMVEPKYKTITYLNEEYFSYYNEDFNNQGIVKIDGTEVTPEKYKSILYIGTPNYFSVKEQNDKYSLIDSTGKEIVKDSDSGFSEGGYIKDGESYKFLVISKGDTSLKLESYGEYLKNYLLYDSKSKTVYDLVTGEKVIEDVEKLYDAYGYIYVKKDKDYTIYQIEK